MTGAEKILGRRVSDQAVERLKQIAALVKLRSNLKDILFSGPLIFDQGYRAEQYHVSLEQSEKIIGLVIQSMNKATR